MNRRTAMKMLGGGIIGLGATQVVAGSNPNPSEIPVNIYQVKELTEDLNENEELTTNSRFTKSNQNTKVDLLPRAGVERHIDGIEVTANKPKRLDEEIDYSVPNKTRKATYSTIQKYNEKFSDLTFKPKFGEFNIEISESIKNPTSILARMAYLKEWMNYDTHIEKSDTSNILIIDSPRPYSFGVGTTPSIPHIYDGHGIVWASHNVTDFSTILSHELGHTIGLQHYHAGKLSETDASLMYSDEYARSVGTNIYGESLTPIANEVDFEFNDKITQSALQI